MSMETAQAQGASNRGPFYMHAILPAHGQAAAKGMTDRGARLTVLRGARYTAIFSDLSDPAGCTVRRTPPSADYRDDAFERAHGRILSQLREVRGDVLPFPPGTVLRDLAPVRRYLDAGAAALQNALYHVHDADEWTVTVEAPEIEAACSGVRREAFQSLYGKALASTFDWLHTELSRATRDGVREDHPHSALANTQTGTYLVPRGEVGAFRDTINRLTGGLARYGWRITATGPRPPSSFLRLAV